MLTSVRQRGLGTTPTAGGPVVIHPGAASPAKCWPVERFVELAGRLKGGGAGGAVRGRRGRAGAVAGGDVARLSAAGEVRQPDTLVGLLDALAGASAFVGNDSGPGHLAAFLGLPTVSLFGPTDPARWQPIGPRVTVLRREPLAVLQPERSPARSRTRRNDRAGSAVPIPFAAPSRGTAVPRLIAPG